MAFDSDVALIGTGLAPLVAASHLLSQGKSVLLLNPDFDFFLENSELALDPALWPSLWSGNVDPEFSRVQRSSPEAALEELSPFFPGPVELWSEGLGYGTAGYHDPSAPHLRSRSRLWISADSEIDDLYVHASDRGLNPQILDHLHAMKRFPGVSRSLPESTSPARALQIPKVCDVDVVRYRSGVLEFLRERLGSERVLNDVSQIELMPGGLRFHWQGGPRTAHLADGAMAFWTPRMTSWILGQAKLWSASPVFPRGARLWEQWSLMSRDALDPGVVGTLSSNEETGSLVAWAETEGNPGGKQLHQLAVLRSGELVSLESMNSQAGWASQKSLRSLSEFCSGFLHWDYFCVRSMNASAILEWDNPRASWGLAGPEKVSVLAGSDGPIVEVVRNARLACERFYE